MKPFSSKLTSLPHSEIANHISQAKVVASLSNLPTWGITLLLVLYTTSIY